MAKLSQQIQELLVRNNILFQIKTHLPTPTSQDSARLRNEPQKIGAKALLFKGDNGFTLCILPADRKVDAKKVRDVLRTKNLRLATLDELLTITGCEKGAVPPFGGLLGVPAIVDDHVFDEEDVAFNAGDLCMSIKLKSKDFRRVMDARVEEFCRS